ncbi:MAG: DUF814 domain-containing protein, partial [Spirochaetes bacterium]|nr:DUF814 domain-containing protein [Spirochaetota bacterium]
MKDLYSLKKQNKLKEIIEIYEENINNNYSLFELNTILESYYKLKYFENGESLSNIILEKYPDNKFTLKWKGYICYEKKDFENAKYFLEKIIYTNSKPFVKDIYILYEVYNKIKEKEKAQRLLNEYKDIFFGSNYYKSWYYKEIIKLENKAPDISINEDNDYIKFLEIKNKINSLGTIEKINEIENLRLIKKYSNNKYLIQHLASLYIKNNNFKKAEKLDQILTQKKLIQKDMTVKKTDTVLDISSFNRLLLKQQWEILIGKSAENNDLLTFKYARKYDIWLHAQGVSGSHVVIRIPDKSQKPPMDIIEQAASAAAFFSSAKNSSTVAVNYTEIRYVRKPRKAPP